MKKLFATMLVVLSSGAAYALPVANPAAASLLCDGMIWEGYCGDMCDPCLTWCDAFSIRVGFWGDYQFNRYLELDNCCEHRDIDVARVVYNAGYLVGNFWDRFDVFATFGAARIDLYGDHGIWRPGAISAVNQTGDALFHLQTTTDFAWSVGLRGTIWECGCTTIGGEFQYMETRPNLRFYDELNNSSTSTALNRYRQAFGNCYGTNYYDWQLGLGVAQRINILVPYFAVRWSHASYSLGDAILVSSDGSLNWGIPDSVQLRNLRSVKTWGYAVGVSLTDCEKMALTLEGDFASSLEMAVIGEIRF